MKQYSITFKTTRRFKHDLEKHVYSHTDYPTISDYIRFHISKAINSDLRDLENQHLIPGSQEKTPQPIIRPMLSNETITQSKINRPRSLTTGEQLTAFAKAIKPPIWLPKRVYNSLSYRAEIPQYQPNNHAKKPTPINNQPTNYGRVVK